MFHYQHPSLHQTVFGYTFSNPLGLAAGFDKDGHLTDIMQEVWFSREEVGSTTAWPYEGNPKPRAVRLIKEQSLIVNYGLKNEGVEKLITTLQKKKTHTLLISISIAKTNCPLTASTEEAIDDYGISLQKLETANVSELYTLNISCPNTFGGEPFTDAPRLRQLLSHIQSLRPSKPILIKMPLNLQREAFKELLDCCQEFPMVQGVVIANLNKDRTVLKTPIDSAVKGNLSGKPTQVLSNELIAKTYAYCGDRLKIIGVGGIFSAEDAYQKIKAGATLLQLITGMIFEGPQLIGSINKGLVRLLHADGYTHISQAIWANHKQWTIKSE